MERQIKTLARRLQAEYVFYFAVTAAFAAANELDFLAKGYIPGGGTAGFAAETVCVLLTLAAIPLSLKLFSVMLLHHRSLGFGMRLRYYRIWSATRLAALCVVTVFDLWVYYATLNSIGGFCALMCIAAALFCCPTRKRISGELETDKRLP